MTRRLPHLSASQLAMLACLLLGGAELFQMFAFGQDFEQIHSLLGTTARAIAEQFTPAPSLVRAGSERIQLTRQLMLGARVALFLAFAVALHASVAQPRRRALPILLAIQLVAVILASDTLPYLMAAELAMLLPLRRGLAWLAAMAGLSIINAMFVLDSIRMLSNDQRLQMAAVSLGLSILFQFLFFVAALAVKRERMTRLELAAANAELQATQSLLADTVRSTERLRIARDLHDAVGHHLTALKLHLDLAERQAGEQCSEALHTSRELASSLLAEVRSVVGTERTARTIDLRGALEALCAGIPEPGIRLHVDPALDITSATLAHALFCSSQEAITNAVRHAQASTLDVSLSAKGRLALLSVQDDGIGARGRPEGNGLRGMRERIEQLGGAVHTGAGTGAGFGIWIEVPLEGAGA